MASGGQPRRSQPRPTSQPQRRSRRRTRPRSRLRPLSRPRRRHPSRDTAPPRTARRARTGVTCTSTRRRILGRRCSTARARRRRRGLPRWRLDDPPDRGRVDWGDNPETHSLPEGRLRLKKAGGVFMSSVWECQPPERQARCSRQRTALFREQAVPRIGPKDQLSADSPPRDPQFGIKRARTVLAPTSRVARSRAGGRSHWLTHPSTSLTFGQPASESRSPSVRPRFAGAKYEDIASDQLVCWSQQPRPRRAWSRAHSTCLNARLPSSRRFASRVRHSGQSGAASAWSLRSAE